MTTYARQAHPRDDESRQHLLAPDLCAALIAPVIDRVRLSTFNATMKAAAPLAEEHGLDRPSLMMIGYLRNLVPDRTVPLHSVAAIFTYASEDRTRPTLIGLAERGMVTLLDADTVGFTAEGTGVAMAIHQLDEVNLRRVWQDEEATVADLLPLLERAVTAGGTDAGPTFAIMRPPHPDVIHLSDAAYLAEHLSALRFHRFDAHIAAWRAAGLTASGVKALAPGAARDAIEAETNSRASTPWAALTPAERLTVLAGLGRLPN